MRRKELPRGELTFKDLDVMREGDSARVQHRSTRQAVKDYSLQHDVWVEWGMNDDSERDRMFLLHIDDVTVVLDAEEINRATRFV